MFKNSKIDWCDMTWNPITGCRYNCSYCYAKQFSRRFSGDVRLQKADPRLKPVEVKTEAGITVTNYILDEPFTTEGGAKLATPAGFTPTLHNYRLNQPRLRKKPASIFVCSMADLFGDWIPDGWIRAVFKACEAAPQHNYLFLTKNPQRYLAIQRFGWLPQGKNFWFGSTITNKTQAAQTARVFDALPSKINLYVSAEPLLENISEAWDTLPLDIGWLIIGAETGSRKEKVEVKEEWITPLIRDCETFGIPVLIKKSHEITKAIPGKLRQEFPPGLKPAKGRFDIPRCKDCAFAEEEKQGERGVGWYCNHGSDRRHMEARYKRTSPPWCPKREKSQNWTMKKKARSEIKADGKTE